ncbi:unnamed protein product [Gadus morhua 'NCC']
MVSLLRALSLCLLVSSVSVGRGEFLDAPPDHALLSLAEKETVLPCRYRDDPGVKSTVVQVTWYKEGPGGSRDQIMAAHHQDGQTAFGPWSGRVRFQSSEPMLDSSLVILTTVVVDEGSYTCHISTFPAGNFDQKLTLTVWTVPISSLDPVILVEGQSYRLAAACRSVARPLPSLSWDTDLNGQSTNRSSDTGSVSSHYSLHPLRSMNGKKLDCLVSHQSLKKPRRLRNNVVVHYPPNAEVSGYSPNWFVGMETAMLHCRSGGNPMPEEFTWTRQGGDLPQGVIPHPNGTLEFGRPLSAGDGGVYQCVVRNVVDSSKATVELKVADEPQKEAEPDNLLLIGVGGAAGGLLLLMLVVIVSVTCHHKRRNKKLERQLTVKDNEISNLVRQASFRRVNSDQMDSIEQMTEKNSLRVEGTIRASLSSLGDQALSRDSRSTLSGGWAGVGGGGGGGMLLDHLGRPSLTNGSRRGGSRILEREEEKRLRVESYARNSTMSLDKQRMHPPLLPSPVPVLHSTEILRTRQPHGTDDGGGGGGGRIANGTRNMQPPPPRCGYPTRGDEEDEEDEGLGGLMCPEVQGRLVRGDRHGDGGHPDDDDDDDPYGSETHSSLMMDAPQVHFQQQAPQHHLTNGTLRPKSRSPLPNPHASHIHKAQIV